MCLDSGQHGEVECWMILLTARNGIALARDTEYIGDFGIQQIASNSCAAVY